MYRVEVELEDGQAFTVDVDGRDIRRWEAEHHGSFLTTDFSYSMLTELARLALVRTRQLDYGSAKFDEVCTTVREVGTAGDPTNPAPTDEPSSDSPSEPGSE